MKRYLKIIKLVFILALIAIITGLSVALRCQNKHNKSLRQQVGQQNVVIDSLLNRKSIAFEVCLYVTDKTKTAIYGKYNKGTINVPQEKHYILTIDSNTMMRVEK